MRLNPLRPGMHFAALIAMGVGLLVAASSESQAVAQHRAVAVAAAEPNLGVSILRDDGRVVSFTDRDELEGPVVIAGLDRVIAITPRSALRDDGAVLTWEPRCYSGAYSDPAHLQCDFPRNVRRVAGLSNVVAISEANGFHLALDKDGSVWGWGNDEDGLISGLPPLDRSKAGRTRHVKAPLRIPLPVPMISVSAGYVQAGAIDRNGNAWTWGGNRFPKNVAAGEHFNLANGLVAVRVADLPPVVAIDATSLPYVVTREGEVWAWGDIPAAGGSGYKQTTAPNKIAGATEIVALSQGNDNTIAMLTKGGTVLYLGAFVPDNQFHGSNLEPRATVRTPPAVVVSGAARITTDGSVLYFLLNRPQAPKHVDIGQ
jgi:hypothetical protein